MDGMTMILYLFATHRKYSVSCIVIGRRFKLIQLIRKQFKCDAAKSMDTLYLLRLIYVSCLCIISFILVFILNTT